MSLGNFSTIGTQYTEGEHQRPLPSEAYTRGEALRQVNTRPNLHMLDAELDQLNTSFTQTGAIIEKYARLETVKRILQSLTPQEKNELARDRSPDGYRYSRRLRRVGISRRDIEVALPTSGAERDAFLHSFDEYNVLRQLIGND
ncbi:hypothetical protein NIES4074_23170 [Cylindrospermum sp. NIES-4074]|nr:hypothetical protein NIES4074_23170 [Cylindrospermum sp. NIES-4074]